MQKWFCLLSIALTVFSLSVVGAGEKAEDYSKDGNLKEQVEVLELQGGVAGFTGNFYTIQADGSWRTGPVLPRAERGEPKAKGKLTGEQLAQLTKELARYDLANLPNYGQPVVDPKVIEVHFGERVSKIYMRHGDSAEDFGAIGARYHGIAHAVKMFCKESKKE